VRCYFVLRYDSFAPSSFQPRCLYNENIVVRYWIVRSRGESVVTRNGNQMRARELAKTRKRVPLQIAESWKDSLNYKAIVRLMISDIEFVSSSFETDCLK